MLKDLDHTEEMPSEADIHLWTHRDDDEDSETVRAILEEPENAEEPEDTEEDPYKAIKQRLHCGGAYVKEIID